jgi:hypothetical protein
VDRQRVEQRAHDEAKVAGFRPIGATGATQVSDDETRQDYSDRYSNG